MRALDASDLEQWLETTIAPRIWLADELGIPEAREGFETVERFWNRWAKASEPPMTAAIFKPSLAAHAGDLRKWLEKKPSDRPFTVAADSKKEAVAFVACLLQHEHLPADARDRAVVFKSASKLRTLAQSSSPFIPIVYSYETEREIVTLYRQRHCIVVRPRNAIDREPDVAVELLSHAAFEQALADMGVERERVDRLTRESGRSPTVLQRQLSQIGAIREPRWAGDKEVARRLMPMALVGAWHNGSKADCEVLAALSSGSYKGVEEEVAALLRYDDCPVWCVGRYRGVVSKIDALFAIGPWMTAKDVTDFVDFAEYVLSESDPALDLPADQRWAAGLYGKVREHSNALRAGICETLVMLSVHGNDLFRERLGINVAAHVTDLVKRLLTPFTTDKLRSHDRDLPDYAEAAPDVFLARIEEDLERQKPVLQELLTPVGASVFEHPARTGVLWALERLAWNPQTLMRVVLVLARLRRLSIESRHLRRCAGTFPMSVGRFASSRSEIRFRSVTTVHDRVGGTTLRGPGTGFPTMNGSGSNARRAVSRSLGRPTTRRRLAGWSSGLRAWRKMSRVPYGTGSMPGHRQPTTRRKRNCASGFVVQSSSGGDLPEAPWPQSRTGRARSSASSPRATRSCATDGSSPVPGWTTPLTNSMTRISTSTSGSGEFTNFARTRWRRSGPRADAMASARFWRTAMPGRSGGTPRHVRSSGGRQPTFFGSACRPRPCLARTWTTSCVGSWQNSTKTRVLHSSRALRRRALSMRPPGASPALRAASRRGVSSTGRIRACASGTGRPLSRQWSGSRSPKRPS